MGLYLHNDVEIDTCTWVEQLLDVFSIAHVSRQKNSEHSILQRRKSTFALLYIKLHNL